MLRKAALGALAALALCMPALARDEVSPQAFAVNNAYSALYHEFGHLFVDQFQLPLLGNEEYAADAIATLMLLREDGDHTYEISFDTVDGYLRSAEVFGATDVADVDFNGEHGLDQQRAAQMTCLLVGGDPANFADLAEQMGFEPERQEACVGEFEQASDGWDRLAADYLRGNGPEGAALAVVYEPAEGRYVAMEDLLREVQVLENVARAITDKFLLQRPATLRAAICGEENAFYDPETSEVTLCYEYVQLYFDLVGDPESAGTDSSG